MESILNYKEEDLVLDLDEGVNDPGIFKAVVLAGGPGSGKSYVAKKLGLKTLGLLVVNSDSFFELLMKKKGLSLKNLPCCHFHLKHKKEAFQNCWLLEYPYLE